MAESDKTKPVKARSITVNIRWVIVLLVAAIAYTATVVTWAAKTEAEITIVKDQVYELKSVPIKFAIIEAHYEAINERLKRVERKIDYIAGVNGYRRK